LSLDVGLMSLDVGPSVGPSCWLDVGLMLALSVGPKF
tara:strand:- start:41 stop:151 length:111 start_codon:yes stop_codon:yes gene_type:complete